MSDTLDRYIQDLVSIVHAQLPRQLQSRLVIKVFTHPYGLRNKAVFRYEPGDTQMPVWVWNCVLEDHLHQDRMVSCKIPATVLAEMCVMVR